MQISVTDIIVILTVLELLVVSLTFFIFKKSKRTNQLLLSAFLFAEAMYLIGYLLFSFFNYIQPDGVHFFFIGTSFGFLLGPILYLYTKSFVKDSYHPKRIDILNLIPFIGYNLIYGFYYYFEPATVKIEMLNSSTVLPLSLGLRINFFMYLQIIIYLGLCLLLLFNYDKRLKSLYSTIHHLSLDWFKFVIFIFVLVWVIDFIHFLIRNTTELNTEISGILALISFSINFVFINFIIYRGLKQPIHFFKAAKELPSGKYKLSSFSDEEVNLNSERLQNYMTNDKPYLTTNLTLSELAQRLGINPLLLLHIIKSKIGKTFFDFINSYRIEDAKRILSDPSKRKMTTLEVLYGVGFDSKIVFKTIFKKFAGVYPQEYKKRYLPYHSHDAAGAKLPN
ncbi:MAG TPA: helix-turn-helix domain-containing protein [Ignavibacteriaceae bacterium]|nr:helix-turn-helix domain-containing protein [Ignavibacteriaceae bacterium]